MSTLLPAAIDFQSDARAIDERRPPWLARATLYAVVAVIVSVVTWAAIVHVDRIVVAPGKLVTTAQTIVLQPLEISVVRSLRAKVGDIVHRGQPLAVLDQTFSEADATQLRDKIRSLDAQIERLQSELDDRPYAPAQQSEEARLQATIWTKSIEEYRAKLQSFDRQIRQVEVAANTKREDHAALQLRLAVAKELEAMRAYLMKSEVGSRISYLDAEAQRMQVERDMKLAQNGELELQQNFKRVIADKAAYLAQFREKAAEELVTARRDRDAAARQLEKAARRNAVTILTAPADAIVLEVAQRSVGSVMKEAEPLYTLVPLDSPLEAEVEIDGRDIGHVAPGAEVRLKLEAWPFQKYGTLPGKVRTISENSFSPESAAGKETPQPQRRYFKARVALEALTLRHVPGNFRLIPGMSVTGEIKAGQRSVLSYLMYPLLRGLDESIREP
jgi:membrane fusion protein, hemolysin D